MNFILSACTSKFLSNFCIPGLHGHSDGPVDYIKTAQAGLRDHKKTTSRPSEAICTFRKVFSSRLRLFRIAGNMKSLQKKDSFLGKRILKGFFHVSIAILVTKLSNKTKRNSNEWVDKACREYKASQNQSPELFFPVQFLITVAFLFTTAKCWFE